jgi:hypothetical protein
VKESLVSVPTVAVTDSRNLQLDQLAKLLTDQSTRRLDVIAGPGAIRAEHGQLVLDGTEPSIGPDGVTMSAGRYAVNDIATAGLADKLGIPFAYLRRLAVEHPDLYDANVNGWLARTDRRFLIRVLRNDAGGGVARAVLSDRYNRIDNLDVLMSALDGVRQADPDAQVASCDLTDRRMYVKVHSPKIQVTAPRLLANYRSPFDGRPGSQLPVVSAGLAISNSETGCGAFAIVPWVRFEVCRNGLVLTSNALRRAHLGSRLGRRGRGGGVVAGHQHQGPGADHLTGHRRGRRVPQPRLRHPDAAPPGSRRGDPDRRPGRHDQGRRQAVAVHRRAAGRDPGALHPRRRRVRRRRHARGHVRSPDPDRRRCRVRKWKPLRCRRCASPPLTPKPPLFTGPAATEVVRAARLCQGAHHVVCISSSEWGRLSWSVQHLSVSSLGAAGADMMTAGTDVAHAG